MPGLEVVKDKIEVGNGELVNRLWPSSDPAPQVPTCDRDLVCLSLLQTWYQP
jgi:hypothetical protein